MSRSRISLDHMKRIIDRAALNGVASLSITGGEPFLYENDVIELVRYASSAGIRFVRTGTNGFMFTGSDRPGWQRRIASLAVRLADTGIHTFWISIDSADPSVHEEMRGLPGVMRGIERALPIFHEHGIYPSANLGINRNMGGRCRETFVRGEPGTDNAELHEYFRTGFRRFYRFVVDAGFTIAGACYPMSTNDVPGEDAVYGAAAADRIVSFSPDEKAVLFDALMNVIPWFRREIRIFTPLCSLHALAQRYETGRESGFPCRGGVDYFFVRARDGHVFPCGFRGGEDIGPYVDFEPGDPPATPQCRECDWECFRDPSELTGPLFELAGRPHAFLGRIARDPVGMRLWWSDISYSRACGFFSCQTAPDYEELARFRGFHTESASRSDVRVGHCTTGA